MNGYFEREDWTLFRNLQTIGQRAGVPVERIPAVVVKELVDNALDASGDCQFGTIDTVDGRGFYVADAGPGLPGSDEDIAALFSVARPLNSTKLIRLPTRGALGNGLRVVAGAVLASAGALVVSTRGRSLVLSPRESDGQTSVVSSAQWDGAGTRVEVRFGPALPCDDTAFRWARLALSIAPEGRYYKGRTSAWWYDSDSFFELLQAAGTRTVRSLIEAFDGCSGRKAGEVAVDCLSRACNSLTRDDAEDLLLRARQFAGEVRPQRLGYVGPDWEAFGSRADAYAKQNGQFSICPARGQHLATIPYIVEAWVKKVSVAPGITVLVNRSPITAEVMAGRIMKDKSDYGLQGCGLSSEFENTATAFRVGRKAEYRIVVNITSPFMPITTDGKEPDLSHVKGALCAVLQKAVKRTRQTRGSSVERRSGKRTILDALPAAISKASGDGRYRYSLRQLFYAVRPAYLDTMGSEPGYNYFAQVVTDHEADLGHDLLGIYRDCRGVLYHPHLHEQIPIGTRSVEQYERPAWTFNKLVYCEKEGFFPILIEARWPERHDCALLTSKGYASRAARDVLDLLADTGEPITLFCIHDADGPGTLIYQSLVGATKARAGRRVKVVNLGLEPKEALAMGLAVERVDRKGRAVPVASYVKPEWREWLQQSRVELNAMDTPTFLEWLDGKLAKYRGKLIPPAPVLQEKLAEAARGLIRDRLAAEAIQQARADERTERAIDRLAPDFEAMIGSLVEVVQADLAAAPERPWTQPVTRLASRLAAQHCSAV